MANTNDLTPIIDAAKKEASRIEEDCNYSSKSHFNAASTWTIRHYLIGVPATIFGACAGAAIIKNDMQLAAGFFSLVATILTGLMTFLKPTETASSHKAVADRLLSLKREARIFREVKLLTMTKADAISSGIEALSDKYNELNEGSPPIPRRAFEKARRGIEGGESTHETDKENCTE